MADLPLNMTKIAFGAESAASLRAWLESHAPGEARITTRYLPTRVKEMEGGSLFWIHAHMIVGRSPILGFEQKEDGRFWVRLSPELIPVAPMPRRAHQGGAIWRARMRLWIWDRAGMDRRHCRGIWSVNWPSWGWFKVSRKEKCEGVTPSRSHSLSALRFGFGIRATSPRRRQGI
jgi:hypothetical protein